MDELTSLAIQAAHSILERERTSPGTQDLQILGAAREFLAARESTAVPPDSSIATILKAD
jgi:hypothetical protein